ncbi:MAG TPA: tRNA uridine-5-carboxymethylaminomethyl(34) synthesis enzyme MnmG, partial [Bauldia sp.]|nr:tRNA uridine-5-carboxymethylaminomethyl(34) synthesis enzyme MnmG [Bauldia sp.]
LGVVGGERAAAFGDRLRRLAEARALLDRLTVTPNEAERHGVHLNRDGVRRTAFQLLGHPDADLEAAARIWPELGALDRFVADQMEIEAHYATYVVRQAAEIEAVRKEEAVPIPADLDYAAIAGLSNELRDKLVASRPATLAQAGRVDGMTPAALTLVLGAARRGSGRHAA